MRSRSGVWLAAVGVLLVAAQALGLHAATAEGPNGTRVSGDVIFDTPAYLWIEPKGEYPRLIARANVTALKDYDGKPQRTDALPALFLPPLPQEKARPDAAALQRWYGEKIDFSKDASLAANVCEAERLLDAYLLASEKDARGLQGEILALKLPPALLREVLLHGHHPALPAPEHGKYYAAAPVPGFPGQEVILTVSVPPKYAADKMWPLLVNLHGTSTDHHPRDGTGEGSETERYVIVAPMGHAAHGWGPSRYGQAQALAAAAWAQQAFRIDPDRVYLQGMSMGGVGTKRIASVYPDRFAAICSLSGPPFKKNVALSYRNLSNLPMLSFQGASDGMIPVEFSRWEKTTVEAEKLPATLYVLDNRGHETFPDHDEERLAFFEKNVRASTPERLRFATYGDGDERCHYYVEITPDDRNNDSYDYNILRLDKVVGAVKAPTPEELQRIGGKAENLVETRKAWINSRELELHADRKANAIAIDKAVRIAGLRIRIPEDLLDLEKEIQVQYQGRVLDKRKVVRSSAWMLQEARRSGRRDVAYWAWIDVTLGR